MCERDLGGFFGQLPGADKLESVDSPDFHLLVIASGHKMRESRVSGRTADRARLQDSLLLFLRDVGGGADKIAIAVEIRLVGWVVMYRAYSSLFDDLDMRTGYDNGPRGTEQKSSVRQRSHENMYLPFRAPSNSS